MSLLFSTLFRFVIAFLQRSKYLLISQLQSPSTVILEPKKIVCHCFHFSPFIFHEVMGTDAMILVFWMLSFKPAFSVSYFTLIKKLFSSSSISATIMVSSTYLRLLIFLPVILLLACASYSLAFCIMYSAYKLNKQGDNTQSFPILIHSFPNFEPLHFSMSGSNFCFLICISVSQEISKVVRDKLNYLCNYFPAPCDSQRQRL